jgi:protein-S-isoprenylcysteine O-methyltransferase Ste14
MLIPRASSLAIPRVAGISLFAAVWAIGAFLAVYRKARTLEQPFAAILFGILASGAYIVQFILLMMSSGGQDHTAKSAVGLLLILCGGCLRCWAMIINKLFFSGWRVALRPDEICSMGPYYFCRHPGYLGAVLMLVGSLAFLHGLSSLYVVIVGTVGYTGLACMEARSN